MNRSLAPISKSLAVAFAFALTGAFALIAPRAACAQPLAASPVQAPEFWFAGTRLILERPQSRAGEIAVASDDPGLGRLLAKLGAALSYEAGQNYVVVYTADRRTVTFALGDAHVTSDGRQSDLPFAPYADGKSAYLPFSALARALGLAPVSDGRAIVLQPQLESIDVSQSSGTTLLTLRAAGPFAFRRVSDAGDPHVAIALLGVGSSLDPQRRIDTDAVASTSIETSGTPRNPTVLIDVAAQSGAAHAVATSPYPNELVLAFSSARLPATARALPTQGSSTAFVATPAGEAIAARAPRAAAPAPAERPTVTPSIAPGQQQPSFATAVAPASAPLSAPPAASASAARITAVEIATAGGSATVHLAITGSAWYQWHRLPDNRWYVDVQNATLAAAPKDESVESDGLTEVRVKQFSLSPPVVRIALQLSSPRAIGIGGDGAGIDLTVANDNDPGFVRAGSGTFGPGGVVAAATPVPVEQSMPQTSGGVTPPPDVATAPGAQLAAVPDGAGGGLAAGAQIGGAGGLLAVAATPAPAGPGTQPWKYAPQGGVAINPRLIVIDPGHGGSDAGSAHNGLTEKDLTLDMSKRLRDVLVARGWQVKMTRNDDRDVFEPNDSAHDELQARVDVANNAGARLFISIHVNAFTDASLNGTTTYYYKSTDLALARALHRRLIASLGTADDGVQKANYYVIHHANAPAALVETAFDSNASDAALLASPAWREKVARAIADGVGDYTGAAPAGDDGT